LMDICVSVEEPRGDQSAGAWRKRSRRKWSEAERREIVLASFAPGASLAGVAREYGINANLLWNWRRKFKQAGETLPARSASIAVDFVPVGTVVEAVTSSSSKSDGLIEVSLPGGARITVDAAVDQQALVRVLYALKAAS
jgi:transposase